MIIIITVVKNRLRSTKYPYEIIKSYLYDAHSDSLTHVANSETSQRREFLESFDAHRFSRLQHHDRSVSAFDAFRILFGSLAGTTVAFLFNLGEFAGDMSSVAVEHRRVTVADLPGMIQDDYLSGEIGSSSRRLIFRITCHVATSQLFHGDVLYVKTDIVARQCLRQRLVMHLHRFHFGGQRCWSECYQHACESKTVDHHFERNIDTNIEITFSCYFIQDTFLVVKVKEKTLPTITRHFS